jgi:glutaminase
LFRGFTDDELSVLLPLLKRRSYPKGKVIVNLGDSARELFFLAGGHVSVVVELVSGASKRLAAFSAGMAFGEMAIIDRAPRSANIVADTDVECDLLELEEFEKLGVSHPTIKIKLLENLSLGLCRKLRKVNRDISVFD